MAPRSNNSLRFLALAVAAALALATPLPSRAEPPEIDRIGDLFRAVAACWRPPGGLDAADVTVLFSLRADGSLIGEPHVTHASILKGKDARADLDASAIKAVRDCTPLRISRRMGVSIAGRMLALRLNNFHNTGI